MIKNLGSTLQQVRKQKNIKLKELSSNTLSISQLSKIEKNETIPSADKFILLLSKLNIKYDEFILLLDDDYLNLKSELGIKFAKLANQQNIEELDKLLLEVKKYSIAYTDIYFKNLYIQVISTLDLIQSNNNYSTAKEYTTPIKNYLSQIDNWTYYELALLSNCLYMFEIDDAIFFGNQAIQSIEENYHFYKNEELTCALLNNLAIYTLDYPKYYSFSLKCSAISEELAFTSRDATKSLYAKIHQQIAYFKLENGRFDKEHLLSYLQTFHILGWDKEYNRIKKFIEKHGITLS